VATPPKSKAGKRTIAIPPSSLRPSGVHLAEHTVLDLDVGPTGPGDAGVRAPRRPLHPHASVSRPAYRPSVEANSAEIAVRSLQLLPLLATGCSSRHEATRRTDCPDAGSLPPPARSSVQNLEARDQLWASLHGIDLPLSALASAHYGDPHVNAGRKLTPWHRLNVDPSGRVVGHAASSWGTLPRSRSLSR
jgi:uncharacterized protein YceK